MLRTLGCRSKVIGAAAIVFLLTSLHIVYSQHERIKTANQNDFLPTDAEPLLPCQRVPYADNVVVIVRTGATEFRDKLPIHFNTTFRCYKDYIIFSDYEEVIDGHQVHDVLRSVHDGLKQSNPDFEIYQRVKQYGRQALHEDELSGGTSFEGSKMGKKDNPGWRLDKWKFLPMMAETLKLRPDSNWYVFVETDTYIVFSNLLQWLQQLDPFKTLYYGSENQISDDIFAHGGSGFVMSKSAVQKAADIYKAKEDEWHQWTDKHWAGDCVLGKALFEAGVPLTWAWPMLQGGQPEKMNFNEEKPVRRKLWCRPAISYHHFSPSEMERMWQFEQRWILSRIDQAMEEGRDTLWKDFSDVLEHRDVFKQFVWPNITTERSDWNNMSPNRIPEVGISTYDLCRAACEVNTECLQFSFSIASRCAIATKEVILGQSQEGVLSGWMTDRIERWAETLDHCGGFDGWLVL